MARRLTKSATDKVIDGVAGGLAEYFGVDPVIVRLAFVAIGLASGGSAILLYIVLMVIMPRPESVGAAADQVPRENIGALGERVGEAGARLGEAGAELGERVGLAAAEVGERLASPADEESQARRTRWLAIGLMVLGLYLLVRTADFFPFPIPFRWWRGFDGDIVWPLVLMGLGLWLLVGRRSRIM